MLSLAQGRIQSAAGRRAVARHPKAAGSDTPARIRVTGLAAPPPTVPARAAVPVTGLVACGADGGPGGGDEFLARLVVARRVRLGFQTGPFFGGVLLYRRQILLEVRRSRSCTGFSGEW